MIVVTALKRRLWLLVLCAALGTGSGWALGRYEIPPVYQSQSLVMVIPNHSTAQNVLNGLVAGQQLVNTYATMATSPALLRSAQQFVVPDLPLSLLARDIAVTAEPNTNLISIVAKGVGASLAKTMAEAVATTLVKTAHQVTGSSVLRMVSSANMNPVPISLSPRALAVALGLMCLVASLCLIVVSALLNDSIVTAQEAIRYTQLPILGEIPLVLGRPKMSSKSGKRRRRHEARSEVNQSRRT